MSQDFTTTGLLASLKRRGMLPSSDQTLATADFLAIATEEMQTYVWDVLTGVREEYAVTDYDLTLTSGTSTYALPPRASGGALRNVLLANGAGNYVPVLRLSPEHSQDFATTGPVGGYYFKDDSVVLVPTPSVGNTLRLQYFRRANKLVTVAECAVITSINAGRTVITTTATVPATMTSGVVLDIVDQTPAFRTLGMDLATTGTVSGTTITLSVALPALVAAGDYVCLAGESPIPQIPVELHPLLAQRVVVKSLEALGDQKMQVADTICERMRKTAISLLSPRSQGSTRYLINRNGPGFGRRFRR